MEEIWKPIKGYEGLYEVSNFGRVKSFHKLNVGVILSTKSTKYLRVGLRKDKKKQMFYVHILVALAFLGPAPSPSHVVNHKDGIKTGNHVENLKWATKSEDGLHAYKLRLNYATGWHGGEKHSQSKLIEENVLEIRASDLTAIQLAKKFNVTPEHIRNIINRNRWRHI